MNFAKGRCDAIREGVIQFEGTMSNGVYQVCCKPRKTTVPRSSGVRFAAEILRPAEQDRHFLWHDRLGHANLDSIKRLSEQGSVIGLDRFKSNPATKCIDSIKGKHHKCTLCSKPIRSMIRGEIIHSDVSGKISIPLLDGSRNYITFIDEFSRYIIVISIAQKSDAREHFIKFHKWFERK